MRQRKTRQEKQKNIQQGKQSSKKNRNQELIHKEIAFLKAETLGEDLYKSGIEFHNWAP